MMQCKLPNVNVMYLQFVQMFKEGGVGSLKKKRLKFIFRSFLDEEKTAERNTLQLTASDM